MAATLPADVCKKLGFKPDTLMAEMPPMSELAEGLDAMLG
jgi:hypothetical protein